MLAIIGGTGLYELQGLAVEEQIDAAATPFGEPSGPLARGRMGNNSVLFLARHGAGHRLLPHEVNYRANLYALKRAGATQVLGVSAVGSLVEAIAPGDLVVPGQYFDWTRGRREATFFGRGVVAHVSTARPVSAPMMAWVTAAAEAGAMPLHSGVTYGCVEGPRLGTRAESFFLRGAGCHVVGMTNVPEAHLAREAQLCYANLGIVTDYDCWMDDPQRHVTVAAIFGRYRDSLAAVSTLLSTLLAGPLPLEDAESRTALAHAMMTPDEALTMGQREWLEVLRR